MRIRFPISRECPSGPGPRLAVSALMTCLACTALLAPALAENPVAPAFERYLEASGGLARIQALESASWTAAPEAYGQPAAMELLADGRLRIEAPDGIVVFDGTNYWRSFHGLVQALEEEQIEGYRELDLWQALFHGLLEPGGRPAALEAVGRETVRGQLYERLTSRSPDGAERTYYLSADTGLLDRLVERVPDADLRERKNIYTFGEYQEAGGLRLATRIQGQCVTNNLEIQPLTRFSDLQVNPPLDRARFARPAATAPAATLEGSVLAGQVLALSGGGSLITNITAGDLGRIGVADGGALIAVARGHEARFPFHAVPDFAGVGRGDYLATFNGTPALWLVKAYVGMRSDDSTYAAGDPVRVTAAGSEEGE